MQPQPPALPFICHKDIKLSEYEILLLSKGPGFMVREDLDKEIFEVEMEKMVAKKKFDTLFKESKDDCAETALDTQNTQNQPSDLPPNHRKSLQGSGDSKSELISNNDSLWESCSGKMVYNMKNKSLDFGNLSAPKYKYNKRICMPDPESPELEVCHEVRRTEMTRIFNRFMNDGQKTNKHLKGTQSHENSNLTRDELIGLKSLKKRIKSGEIIICETDKSKKFAALKPEQYFESGLQHTAKDLEIEPEKVKRIQNVVNSHVEWLKDITNIGKNVGHESRMSKNLSDKGEQVCNMSLLLKDHKKWVCGSDGPIPSRPVISGNNGLNCHLSELVSAIIDPVASEMDGREIDSTDDMLSKINELNEKLEGGVKISNGVCLDENVENVVLPDEQTNHVIETNKSFEKGDIRNFGKSGIRTDDASLKANQVRIKSQIEALKVRRTGGSVIPEFSDRMNASILLDKLEGKTPIKLPEQGAKRFTKYCKQKGEGISIVGSDVKSLFPALKSVETARLARYAIVNSNVKFQNWNFHKALRYLFIVGGMELLSKHGLARLAPRWLGDRADLITVGGLKSKCDSSWADSGREVLETDEAKIVAAVVEVAINVVQATHVYKFCGHYYVQLEGGAIGLTSTASLASLVMKLWDMAWLALLERENITVLLFFRYVDDIRNFLPPLQEGWRWYNGCFQFSTTWLEEDLLSGLTDEQRTTRELVAAMDSLLDFIQFEGEEASMFSDSRLPTLDTAIWVCELTGKIKFSFYEKPTCPNTVVHRDTALNSESIRATLVQETVRRLKHCSLDLPLEEKQLVLSCFAQKMRNSGHSVTSIQYVLVHGVIKFLEMVKVSTLDKHDPRYKPLHCDKRYNIYNRKLSKFLSKSNWYSDESIVTKTKWRQNVPSEWIGSRPAQFRVHDMPYSTLMQVPCSEDSKLFRMLAKAEPRLAKLTRYQVKYVERSGKPLKNFFSVKDFSGGRCHRLDCNVCSNSKPGKPTRCQVKGVIYEGT